MWKPASVGRDVEDQAGDAGLEVGVLRRRQLAVDEQADRRRLGDRGADLGDRLDGVAQVRGRWRRQSFDQDLVRCAEADQPRFDPDVAGRGQCGLGLPAAGRVIAVGQQDDALLGIVGEERGRQAQGRADVGRRADGRRGQSIDLAQVRRQALHERLLAERDDAGHVPIRDDVEGLAQECQGVLAAVVPDRVREVHDEHGRKTVDRQDDPEPGQGEHERDEEHRSHHEGDAPSSGAEPAAGAEVQDDGQADRRDQQEQRERDLEAEAHQAGPPASRRRRVLSARRIRTTPSRW